MVIEWWFFMGVLWDLPSGYVKIARENEHKNSGFVE